MIGTAWVLGLLAVAPAQASSVVPVALRVRLEQAPLDPALRLELAQALLARGDRADEALETLRALASDPDVGAEARRVLYAALLAAPPRAAWSELVRTASVGRSPADAAALRARKPEASAPVSAEPPVDAATLRAQAEARISGGDPGAARLILSAALDADPADRVTLGVYTRAAIAGGDVLPALSRTRAGLAAAPDARARAALLDDVVALEVLAAEQLKQAGQPDDAMDSYFLALAVAPGSLGTLRGAAGLAWQLQDFEAAWSLYSRALALAPDDVDTLLSAVSVGLAAGHDVEAQRLIDRSTSKDARVLALRSSVAQAMRSRDARAALRAGDAATAAAAFQALLALGPDAEAYRGLATALTSLGRNDEALAAWEGLLDAAPGDAWAAIGLANALVALDRPTEARTRLAAAFPADAPVGAEDERRRVVARAWRADAEHARAAGDTLGAWEAYAAAVDSFPEVWGCVGLAGLYLGDHQPALALDFYDEALRLSPGVPEAAIGRAQALDALGRFDEAQAALDGLGPLSAPLQQLRGEVASRVAVGAAMALRHAGDAAAAERRVVDALAAGPTADLEAALATLRLDRGDAAGALDAARQGLALDATSRWARQALVAAARAGSRSAEVLGLLEQAVAADPGAAADLDDARLDAGLQAAAGQHGDAAASAIAAVAPLATSAEQLDRLGGAWLAAGRGAEAQAAFEHALARAPGDVDARVGRAGAVLAQGRRAAAIADLRRAFAATGDGRFGLALAEAQAGRGDPASAARTLRQVAPEVVVPEPAPEPTPPPRLDAVPLPSGRAWSQPSAPTAAVRTLDLRAERARIQADVDRQRGPRATAGVVGVDRRMPRSPGLTALLVPIDAGPFPLGPVRADVEAVPVHADDGSVTADGVAMSVGVASPDPSRLAASARVGVSPIGFVGGVYPVWSAQLAGHVGPDVVLGVQTDRAPRADSRVSWAGGVDSLTGQTFGRVSELDLRGLVAATPGAWELGLTLRGGYVEGIGVAPDPFGEAVGWTARHVAAGPLDLRLGVDGVGMAYARQEDRQVLGQGGFFSPPLFTLGLARVDVRLPLDRAGVCAGVAGGPRWLSGVNSTFAGAGLGATGTAHLGAAFRLAPRWALTVDARGQLNDDGWHQIGALARVGWGLPNVWGVAPTLTTVVAPSLALPTDTDLCRIDP